MIPLDVVKYSPSGQRGFLPPRVQEGRKLRLGCRTKINRNPHELPVSDHSTRDLQNWEWGAEPEVGHSAKEQVADRACLSTKCSGASWTGSWDHKTSESQIQSRVRLIVTHPYWFLNRDRCSNGCKGLDSGELGEGYAGTLYCLCNFSVSVRLFQAKKFKF